MIRLLLIENDGDRARRMIDRLHFEYHLETFRAASGTEALGMLETNEFDLIAASADLPDLSGEQLLIALRGRKAKTPVLLFAASADTWRRLRYYRLGANDIMPNPPDVDEAVARIWNLLRLVGNSGPFPIRIDDMRIDPAARKVEVQGEPVPLTPTEFDLLLHLVRNEGKPLTREQLLTEVWGYEFAGNTNLVDVYIRYLRMKIDKKFRKKQIRTVRGVGYMFDVEK